MTSQDCFQLCQSEILTQFLTLPTYPSTSVRFKHPPDHSSHGKPWIDAWALHRVLRVVLILSAGCSTSYSLNSSGTLSWGCSWTYLCYSENGAVRIIHFRQDWVHPSPLLNKTSHTHWLQKACSVDISRLKKPSFFSKKVIFTLKDELKIMEYDAIDILLRAAL